MNAHDESKLPRWAQIRLEQARNNEALAKRRLSQIGDAVEGERRLEVGRVYPVTFQLDTPAEWQWADDYNQRLRVQPFEYEGKQWLQVHGGTGLLVRPWSGNVVLIRPERS